MHRMTTAADKTTPGIVYQSARAPSAISPILDQRLINIEGAIERSDTTTRDEFGRGRDEARESSA
jgi:hypothetical protein